jgi:hypothetical protein
LSIEAQLAIDASGIVHNARRIDRADESRSIRVKGLLKF